MILFIIPHAGGSIISYGPWKNYFENVGIRVVPLELPGHMMRASEEQLIDEIEIVKDIMCSIETYIGNRREDYAIFGHSMGAALAYRVTVEIERKGLKPPRKIFLSGRWAPYFEKEEQIDLSDMDIFSKQMIKFGGINEQIVNNPQLCTYFLRILWVDFKLVQNLCKDKTIHKINIDMVVLYGKYDKSMNLSDVESWRLAATKSISFEEIEGNHFYPILQAPATVKTIMKYLK